MLTLILTLQEDIMEEPAPRMFWPRDIWSKYADKLEDLKEPANRTQAVRCLNHMVSADHMVVWSVQTMATWPVQTTRMGVSKRW